MQTVNFNRPILSLPDVEDFFNILLNENQCNFHPDDSFKDTYHADTELRTFSDEEADRLDNIMQECIDYCRTQTADENDETLYSIAFTCFHYWHEKNVLVTRENALWNQVDKF